MGRIKKIILDIISFNTPEARFFNLDSILILLRIIPTSSLESSPIKCVFKTYLLPLIFKGSCPTTGIFVGCNCPACGMTRGMSRLLRGDFLGAYEYNKLVFLVFLVMILLLVYNGYKVFKKRILKTSTFKKL